MRPFNSVLATLLALALIAGSSLGVVYLVGVLTGAPGTMALVDSALAALRGLNTAQVQAILLGIALVALILFVLEVRPWKPRFIVAAESARGTTYIQRSDIEQYLIQRLAKEKALSPERIGLNVYGNRFGVEAEVVVSTLADVAAVREQVERNVKGNLTAIGLNKELERVETRVQRLKRAA